MAPFPTETFSREMLPAQPVSVRFNRPCRSIFDFAGSTISTPGTFTAAHTHGLLARVASLRSLLALQGREPTLFFVTHDNDGERLYCFERYGQTGQAEDATLWSYQNGCWRPILVRSDSEDVWRIGLRDLDVRCPW